jgi:hypothetical protein
VGNFVDESAPDSPSTESLRSSPLRCSFSAPNVLSNSDPETSAKVGDSGSLFVFDGCIR